MTLVLLIVAVVALGSVLYRSAGGGPVAVAMVATALLIGANTVKPRRRRSRSRRR